VEIKEKAKFGKVDGLFSRYVEYTPEYCQNNNIEFNVQLKALDGIKNLEISEFEREQILQIKKTFEQKGYDYQNFLEILRIIGDDQNNAKSKSKIKRQKLEGYSHQIELYFFLIEKIHLDIFGKIKDRVSMCDKELQKELEEDPEGFWESVPSNVKTQIAIKIKEISKVTQKDKQNL
jgi:hypothetical protein